MGDEEKSREQLIRELAILRRQISQVAPISDSMNQSLYGLNLYANAATERLASGDVALALDYLQEFHRTTQSLLSTAQLLAHHLCAAAHQGREERRAGGDRENCAEKRLGDQAIFREGMDGKT